jgi:hypothetical protein
MNRIILLLFIFIAGCNQSSKQSDSIVAIKGSVVKDTVSKAGTYSALTGCYVSTIKKDTANLKMEINNSEASGSLVYKRFETDGNVGTIKGKVQDSLIIADYTFKSEGLTSVREVVFKIQGENLIEGYGDIAMKGDTARFKNITQLKFQEGQPFVKMDCK